MGKARNKTEVKFVAGLTELKEEASQGHNLGKPGPPGPGTHKCITLSMSTYRPYTFYHTDVDSTIQTIIETVGIYGTDVQTVED